MHVVKQIDSASVQKLHAIEMLLAAVTQHVATLYRIADSAIHEALSYIGAQHKLVMY
jgi:hypothetical protein